MKEIQKHATTTTNKFNTPPENNNLLIGNKVYIHKYIHINCLYKFYNTKNKRNKKTKNIYYKTISIWEFFVKNIIKNKLQNKLQGQEENINYYINKKIYMKKKKQMNTKIFIKPPRKTIIGIN